MQFPELSRTWPAPLHRLIIAGLDALNKGERQQAADMLRQALAVEPNIPEAHLGLTLALRPGPSYLDWLDWLHKQLLPAVYLEIGVETGRSLRLARPPTRAIGIEPELLVTEEAFEADTQLHPLTSAAFFADPAKTAPLLSRIDLAYIDGDHRFPAVLADFIGLEPLMRPDGVIAVHDVWPIDELTAQPERTTGFYTGDVWRLIPCLKAVRPDLRILTLATAPSGLALISGFNPASSVLTQRYEALCDAFGTLPYASLAADPAERLSLLANDGTTADQLARWLVSAGGRAST